MNILIVGGNACGMSAAARLRRTLPEAQITVLEKGNLVSFGACGLPYFVGDNFPNPDRMIARPIEAFQKSGITVHLHHEAVRLNASQKIVEARNAEGKVLSFPYDRLLISTGASPIVPPLEGITLAGVHTLSKMEDGIALKEALKSAQNIVIAGGGFIGLETAEALVHLGKKVTLIEKESRLSARVFEPEITALLQEAVANSGVDLRLEESLTAVEGHERVQKVKTDKNTYDADLLLVALGFRPQTAWLEGQLPALPNGALKINASGRTSLPDVFAGGDCAVIPHALGGDHYLPLATGANKMGRLLGDILAGKEASFQGSLGSAGLRFCSFEAGRVGLGLEEARNLGWDAEGHFISDFTHTDYVPGRSELFIKLIYDKKSRILLGGQVCGKESAVLRADILAAAVFKKMTVDELGMLDLIYAPPFARTWEALNIAGNTVK